MNDGHAKRLRISITIEIKMLYLAISSGGLEGVSSNPARANEFFVGDCSERLKTN